MAYYDLTLSFFFSFLMWTVFKVFTEFVTTLLLFSVLVFWPQGMWNLSSPTTRIELTLPALKAVLPTGQAGKSPGPHPLTAFLWPHAAPDIIRVSRIEGRHFNL